MRYIVDIHDPESGTMLQRLAIAEGYKWIWDESTQIRTITDEALWFYEYDRKMCISTFLTANHYIEEYKDTESKTVDEMIKILKDTHPKLGIHHTNGVSEAMQGCLLAFFKGKNSGSNC